MRSIDEDVDGMYARWMLEDAQVRAMARRQLSLSVPIVIAGAFAAVILSFNFGHAAPPPSAPPASPVSAPSPHRVVVLVSGRAAPEIDGRPAEVRGSLPL